MCDKVRTAIEVIKTQKKRALTKGEIVVLFQQVAADLGKQGERMTNLEKEVSTVKEEMRQGFDEVNQRLNDVMDAIRYKEKTFWEKIPILKEIPLPVWLILWTIVTGLFCLLGVNPEFIKDIHIGG